MLGNFFKIWQKFNKKVLYNPVYLYFFHKYSVYFFKEACALVLMVLWSYTGTNIPPLSAKSMYFDFRNYNVPLNDASAMTTYMAEYLPNHPNIGLFNLLGMFAPGPTAPLVVNHGEVYQNEAIYKDYHSVRLERKESSTVKEFIIKIFQGALIAANPSTWSLQNLMRYYGVFLIFVIYYEFLLTTVEPYLFLPDQVDPSSLLYNLNHHYVSLGSIHTGKNSSEYDRELKSYTDYTTKYVKEIFKKEEYVIPPKDLNAHERMLSQEYQKVVTKTVWIPRNKGDLPAPKKPIVLFSNPFVRALEPAKNFLSMDNKKALAYNFLGEFSQRLMFYASILLILYLFRTGLKEIYQRLVSKGYNSIWMVFLKYLAEDSVYSSLVTLLLLRYTLVYDPYLMYNAIFGSHAYHFENIKGTYQLVYSEYGCIGPHTILGWIILFCIIPALDKGGYSALRTVLVLDSMTQPETLMNTWAYAVGRGGGLLDPNVWAQLSASSVQGPGTFLITLASVILNVSIFFEISVIPLIFIGTGVRTMRTFLRYSWVENGRSLSLLNYLHWIKENKKLTQSYQDLILDRITNNLQEVAHASLLKKQNLRLDCQDLLSEMNLDLTKKDSKILGSYNPVYKRKSNIRKIRALEYKENLYYKNKIDTSLGKVMPLIETNLEDIIHTTLTQRWTTIALILSRAILELFFKLSILIIKYTLEVSLPLILVSIVFNQAAEILAQGTYRFNTQNQSNQKFNLVQEILGGNTALTDSTQIYTN